jgi:hypothetical protein
MSEKSDATLENGADSTPSQNGAQEFLTREEAERWKADILEQANKRTQSLTDKSESRIEKRIKEGLQSVQRQIEMNQSLGIEMTPSQIEDAKNRAIRTAYADESSEQTQTQTSTNPDVQGMISQAEARAVDEIAEGYEKEKGVKLEDDDPEWKKFFKKGMTKAEYLRAYDKALDEKKVRISQNPAGSNPSTGGSAGQSALMQEYSEKLSKLPRGNAGAIIDLKREYRNKGLKI